jgi:hypothetical protein
MQPSASKAFATTATLLLAVLWCSGTATARGPAGVPAEYLGEWNAPLSACGTSNSDAKLVIGKSRIDYNESKGVILQVDRRAPKTIDIVARYSGEGEHWTRQDHLTLSGSGNVLSVDAGKDSVVRHRCPAPSVSRRR